MLRDWCWFVGREFEDLALEATRGMAWMAIAQRTLRSFQQFLSVREDAILKLHRMDTT